MTAVPLSNARSALQILVIAHCLHTRDHLLCTVLKLHSADLQPGVMFSSTPMQSKDPCPALSCMSHNKQQILNADGYCAYYCSAQYKNEVGVWTPAAVKWLRIPPSTPDIDYEAAIKREVDAMKAVKGCARVDKLLYSHPDYIEIDGAPHLCIAMG